MTELSKLATLSCPADAIATMVTLASLSCKACALSDASFD